MIRFRPGSPSRSASKTRKSHSSLRRCRPSRRCKGSATTPEKAANMAPPRNTPAVVAASSPGTGGSWKQAVPQPAETGAERKGRDRHLLRDHRRQSRAQRHQTRGRLLDNQGTQTRGDKAGRDLGHRGARSEIGLDRSGEPAAKIRVGAGRSDEECGCSLVRENRLCDRIAIRDPITPPARYFEQFGCHQPLDLARDLGLQEEAAARKPCRHPLSCRPVAPPRP